MTGVLRRHGVQHTVQAVATAAQRRSRHSTRAFQRPLWLPHPQHVLHFRHSIARLTRLKAVLEVGALTLPNRHHWVGSSLTQALARAS